MTADQLKALWETVITGFTPKREQFALWIIMHGPDVTKSGVQRTAKKYLNVNGQMDDSYLVRYASSVMANESKKAKGSDEYLSRSHR